MKKLPTVVLKMSEVAIDTVSGNLTPFTTEIFYFLNEFNEANWSVHTIGYEPFILSDAKLKRYKRSKTVCFYLWNLAQKIMDFRDFTNRREVRFEVINFSELSEADKALFEEKM